MGPKGSEGVLKGPLNRLSQNDADGLEQKNQNFLIDLLTMKSLIKY